MYRVNRSLSARLLGALGILEQSAPHRFQAMVDGCIRLGIPEYAIEYQQSHVQIDESHAKDYLDNVLLPIVDDYPEIILHVAEGVVGRFYVASTY